MTKEESQRNTNKRAKKSLREIAIDVLKKLVEAGHTAYFAGGCVRDRLMGHDPIDYDIATDAQPEYVAKVFPRVQTVGESFGVMIVRRSGQLIQVATFRTDDVYSDGRRPDSVTFTDAQHDARRRDFTINGLFEDPLNDQIIDYVNGQADLKAKIIRAIGDPHERLREDRLRTLRAVRFASRFGFHIEGETAKAIQAAAEDLRGVSRERVGHEVRRMLTNENRLVAAMQIESLGLDSSVLLEEHCNSNSVYVKKLPDEVPFTTALAAWLLDRHCERPSSDFDSIARQWADALVLSNDERFSLCKTIEIHQSILSDWSQMNIAAQKRLASSQSFDQGLLLVQSTDENKHSEVCERVAELEKTGLAPEPFITGSDLLEMGLVQGPKFGSILRAVYDAQLEGEVREKKEAIEFIRKLMA